PSGSSQETFEADKEIRVEIHYEVKQALRGLRFTLHILTQEGDIVFLSTDHGCRDGIESPGVYKTICKLPGKLLNKRSDWVRAGCDVPVVQVVVSRRDEFGVAVSRAADQSLHFPESWPGVVCPEIPWQIESLNWNVLNSLKIYLADGRLEFISLSDSAL